MAVASRILTAAALLAAMGFAAASAQAQTAEQARVVSSSPLADGGYNVVYEYAGRRYSTRTDGPPGPTLEVQVSAVGVTTSPVRQSGVQPRGNGGWEDVVAEPGVVVSGNAAPVYAQQPVPVYVQPAPVYVQPYGYAAPYYAAPIGLSLNLGYSRGWGGGWRHRGW